ncbi:NAD(P)-binding protein [Dichomitus squalens]|uniref:NAD(P)-binding protein n=1 Tax=Dichomitus squalens TaxID=114155 RepID=A0A4Q9MFW2_9APHY|nr:NAD(P)-binding protein [Dichomitus squalens]
MKVFILGATGFIGLPIAQAFVRAGHVVYGQTRSEEKAKQLTAEEIIPIVCDPSHVNTYMHLIPTLDVIVDAVGGSNLEVASESLLNVVATAASTLRHFTAPRLTYIYTSGTWVHGENRKDVVSDTTAVSNPIELTAWRPEQEQRVINNSHVNGIVIRPSLLYGRSGSLFVPLFRRAYEGKVAWHGEPGGRLALIHCDDLAEVYVLAAEKAALAGGKIFDASNDINESADAFLQRLVEVSGALGPYEYLEPTNLFEKALGTTTIIRPYLARALLGWHPRKAGLIDHLEVYYNSWKASEGLP